MNSPAADERAGPTDVAPMSVVGTYRLRGPVPSHFRYWRLTGGVAPVPCRPFSFGCNPPSEGAAAGGTKKNTDLAD